MLVSGLSHLRKVTVFSSRMVFWSDAIFRLFNGHLSLVLYAHHDLHFLLFPHKQVVRNTPRVAHHLISFSVYILIIVFLSSSVFRSCNHIPSVLFSGQSLWQKWEAGKEKEIQTRGTQELSRCVNGCNYDNQRPTGRGRKWENQSGAVDVSHQVEKRLKASR